MGSTGDRPPRLAFFVPSMQGGGAERVIADLVVEFESKGYEVDLLLVHAEGPFLDRIPETVRVIDLKGHRIGATIPHLTGYLKRTEPAALLSTITEANVAAVLAKTLSRSSTRVVLRVANTASMRIADVDSVVSGAFPHLIRFCYPRADHVVAVSEGVKDDLVASFGVNADSISAIHNPKRVDDIRATATDEVESECVRTDDPIVLGVGRLVEQKDFRTLVRAFDRVIDERAARLVIVGEGPQRSELEALVRDLDLRDDVRLPGFTENPFRYMRAADVVALSSRWEGSPNVLVEAMACGTPVVATDCPSGPAEILEDGKYGPLTPVGDHVALAEAIVSVIDSPPESRDLLERARDFSIENVVPKYERVLFDETG